jgi:hypothetical protein
VKKIVVAKVWRVPSAFDDDMIVKPSHKGFFSCQWPNLRFNVRRHYTPGSENEFVDVETFSDDVVEVQKEVAAPATAAAEVADPQPSGPQDKASPEFTKELEMTVHRGKVLCKMFLWSRLAKIFLKARTLLPRLFPSIKVSVRPTGGNC